MAIHGKIVKTGSDGNCVIFHKKIVVDIGIPYLMLKPYIKDIQIILLTHCHSDHFNLNTLKKILLERPAVRIAAGKWMLPYLNGLRNIDILDLNKWYDYRDFKLSIGKLYHDVDNGFWRIDKQGYKIIYATDTYTLDGISARYYNEYWIEANYDADTVHDIIHEKQARGEYAHQIGSINSHLSRQQAQDFVLKNAGENYEFILLHQSKSAF
ncbi:MAG: MBL fold metallo-hydrolase [Prevotella sp.]|jgi:hypothetical protein|nr:MBL fold metallo-hydrolase [Prevotella sp.]